MKRFPPEKIRNVVLVGHHGSGKTTLAEAVLHTAGAIPRRGRVEDGTTTTDGDPEEKDRGMSLSLALAPFEWRDHKINLLDCPGEADYTGALHAALSVADLAVVVVSGVEGVEAQTEAAWELAAELGVPRLVFVNKLDRERSDFERVLADLREKFGSGFAPLELPIGREAELRGLVDVLHETADLYDGDGKATHDNAIPEELADLEHKAHDEVVEEIVAGDDGLLERFLADDVPTVEELEHALTIEMEHNTEFPVLCGSAHLGVGVDRLADYIVEIGPPPTDRPVSVSAGDQQIDVAVDPDGDPLAYVFHTIADPYVGHLSLFRVLSGTIKPDDHLVNSRTSNDERLHGLFTLRGKEHLDVPAVPAGDIGAVAKLADTRTGDTLAPKGSPVKVAMHPLPPPAAAIGLVPRTQSDEDKMGTALARLCEEDPTLVVGREASTGQYLLRGLGDVQLNVAIDRLQRRFGVGVDTEPLKVAFRETITATAEAEGKHKKQTGGHGQFAVCTLRVEPSGRGEGFQFTDKIVGGAISRGYIPAVQKGVEEAMGEGGVRGFPVVDVAVTLLDGKEHTVDSSELAFKLAARLAFREAMAAAGPVVLEPIALLEIDVPGDLLGDVLGDLNARRGRVAGTTPGARGRQFVSAYVPMAELVRYAAELRSLTGGRGRFRIQHDHDEVVPSNLVDRMTAGAMASAGR
ncbi:MAG: elongation factor G [Acidimicrobiales bacterium]